MILEFEYKIQSKPRMTRQDIYISSKNFRPQNERLYKRHLKLREYWDFKENIRLFFMENNIDYSQRDVLSDITFVISMPKSWSDKKKKAYEGKPHKNKPDLNNLVKALEDCLFDEDKYIWEYRNIRKIWGYTDKIIFKI
jgi:Holliday junction resolvase RusA-like endonuclease